MERAFHIADFAALAPAPVYADRRFFALSPLSNYPTLGDTLCADCLLLLLCTEGGTTVLVDGKAVEVAAGDCIVCPPGCLIGRSRQTGRAVLTLVGYSLEALARMLTGGERVWQVLQMLTRKPIVNNNQRYLYDRVSVFLNILLYRTMSNDLFRDELTYHLFAALFFDIINDLHVPAAPPPRPAAPRYRTGDLYKQFLALMGQDGGRNRSVAWFADQLFVTPKHLSKVVKRYAGRPALDAITDHAVDILRTQLRYTDQPMKDIAEEMRFESYPAFCKFVKKHLGATPQQYRQGKSARP